MVKIKKKNWKKVGSIAKIIGKNIKIKGLFRLEFKSIHTVNIKNAWLSKKKRWLVKQASKITIKLMWIAEREEFDLIKKI